MTYGFRFAPALAALLTADLALLLTVIAVTGGVALPGVA